MSDTLKLGQIITTPQHRDAIHIAVAPVTAGEALKPGQHVGLVLGYAHAVVDSAIGIVDPFLGCDVNKGEVFWLFLYPGTIKGLRHEWVHPAFPVEEGARSDREESEKWLRAYAATLSPYDDPEEAFRQLVGGLMSKEIFAHGTDLHGFGELDNADELKTHAERVLGITIRWSEFTFHCSC